MDLSARVQSITVQKSKWWKFEAARSIQRPQSEIRQGVGGDRCMLPFSVSPVQDPSQEMVPPTVSDSSHLKKQSRYSPKDMSRDTSSE